MYVIDSKISLHMENEAKPSVTSKRLDRGGERRSKRRKPHDPSNALFNSGERTPESASEL